MSTLTIKLTNSFWSSSSSYHRTKTCAGTTSSNRIGLVLRRVLLESGLTLLRKLKEIPSDKHKYWLKIQKLLKKPRKLFCQRLINVTKIDRDSWLGIKIEKDRIRKTYQKVVLEEVSATMIHSPNSVTLQSKLRNRIKEEQPEKEHLE